MLISTLEDPMTCPICHHPLARDQHGLSCPVCEAHQPPTTGALFVAGFGLTMIAVSLCWWATECQWLVTP